MPQLEVARCVFELVSGDRLRWMKTTGSRHVSFLGKSLRSCERIGVSTCFKWVSGYFQIICLISFEVLEAYRPTVDHCFCVSYSSVGTGVESGDSLPRSRAVGSEQGRGKAAEVVDLIDW